jgi:hypothetical protein
MHSLLICQGESWPPRMWSPDLRTESIALGRYCLYAEYLISEQLIDTALGLPKDKALVATGRIAATPVEYSPLGSDAS